MILIYKVEANSTLNKKAETFALTIKSYEGLLVANEVQYKQLVEGIDSFLAGLNAQYPRTKPFIIYSKSRSGLYVCPEGKPDIRVMSMSIAHVKSIYSMAEGLVPADEFKIVKK